MIREAFCIKPPLFRIKNYVLDAARALVDGFVADGERLATGAVPAALARLQAATAMPWDDMLRGIREAVGDRCGNNVPARAEGAALRAKYGAKKPGNVA